MFHGILVETTRRLDCSSGSRPGEDIGSASSPIEVWMEWVRTQSIRRLAFHAFIFDVEKAILYGGDPIMTPFELNYKTPIYGIAWFASSQKEWAQYMTTDSDRATSCLVTLKETWNPSTVVSSGYYDACESVIILYGLVCVARLISRHEETASLKSPASGLDSLGKIVEQSLRRWELAREMIRFPERTLLLGPDCMCVMRLAFTLYEIDPIDLQTVAGRAIIESKKRGRDDYARSKRKIRIWARSTRAYAGVANAALLIQTRLDDTSPVTHCHHCLWSLYLAALICWNFGFALTSATRTNHLVAHGQILSAELAEQECFQYLQAATSPMPGSQSGRQRTEEEQMALSRTVGMLIVVTRLLRQRSGSSMIDEGVKVLSRLMELSVR
ncbi:hypothetical protein BDW59DRAFT_132613 [Aspergillus cavernicola]|uniref:Transcription factor domain-containing protein n=1 Tax=Aspergillus cavernicola TaxID=176166 RepID=A0ABR4HPU7_9EURO